MKPIHLSVLSSIFGEVAKSQYDSVRMHIFEEDHQSLARLEEINTDLKRIPSINRIEYAVPSLQKKPLYHENRKTRKR